MIDSHCHLNVSDYDDDLDDVIDRARAAGVHGILVPAIDLLSCERAIAIAERHPMVRVAVGVHPHEAESWNDAAETRLRAWAEHPAVVAIGEIGLDFYRDWSPVEAQRVAYSAQLRLACDLALPVVVHDRNAHDEVLAGIADPAVAGLTGVLHCFSGGPSHAERALELGFHISFTGTLTFGKGKADRVLRRVPLDRLLLETDSPYMTPEPHRGQRNEPAWVGRVADALAEKLDRPRREVLEATSAAAGALFGFPAEPD